MRGTQQQAQQAAHSKVTPEGSLPRLPKASARHPRSQDLSRHRPGHESHCSFLGHLPTISLATLLLHLDNNTTDAQRLLVRMLARRDQWLRRAGDPPTRAELEAAGL